MTKKKVCEKCAGTGVPLDHHKIGLAAQAKRLMADLSLQEVARHMNVSPSYLCDIEHGRRDWTARLIALHNKAVFDLSK